MSESDTHDPDAAEHRLGGLITAARFCVLCTQGESQPYGSLLCFAPSDPLRRIAFATPRTTRKYALLSRCPQVALVFDNRERLDAGSDVLEVEAVTATGVARELVEGPPRDRWLDALVARYPEQRRFFVAPSCALFEVDLLRCFHVARFQEVFEWRPDR